MEQNEFGKAKTSLENASFSPKMLVENSDGKMAKKVGKSRKNGILVGVGVISAIGGVACALIGLFAPKAVLPDLVFPDLTGVSEKQSAVAYSRLTGMPVAQEAVNAPAYCVQTPNGTDGARPQAGLDTAGVVFEAIAEAGITRFAAIYQDPTAAVIGPIRSLRIYYLKWDTPFDCAIVHAGGAPDALEAVARGYKDLTENYAYMYRGSERSRLWNNLFTTGGLLAKADADRGWGGSEVQGFSRMTPEESLVARVDAGAEKLVITEAAKGDTSVVKPAVSKIAVNFGNLANYNVRYEYDEKANVYFRSYESGAAHEVYHCPEDDLGEADPEKACSLVQMAPAVVAVIRVNEKKASDNYHEDITVVGTGEAVVFQNGMATTGSWTKGSDGEQIKFFDEKGAEIKLAPGQTFVEAVPNYGSVQY